MHKQQKTFTPASLVLPLALTALVIFLASSASAQNVDPATEPEPAPLRLEDPIPPIEATLAPRNAEIQKSMGPANDGSLTQMETRNATSTERPAGRDTAVRNDAAFNQNSRADLGAKKAEWARALAERSEMLERKRSELASTTLARRAAFSDKAQERVRQMAQVSTNRLTEFLSRIKNFSSNLRDKSESLSLRGVDVSEATLLLDQVDELIRQAEASLSGIDINIEYTLTSENPLENWMDAKTQLQTTAEIIRTIRPLLQETVVTLREAIKNATTEEPA